MTGGLLQFDSVAHSGLHRVAPRSPGATRARTQGGAEVQVSFQSTDRGSGCSGGVLLVAEKICDSARGHRAAVHT